MLKIVKKKLEFFKPNLGGIIYDIIHIQNRDKNRFVSRCFYFKLV